MQQAMLPGPPAAACFLGLTTPLQLAALLRLLCPLISCRLVSACRRPGCQPGMLSHAPRAMLPVPVL